MVRKLVFKTKDDDRDANHKSVSSRCKPDKHVFLLLSWFTPFGTNMQYLNGDKSLIKYSEWSTPFYIFLLLLVGRLQPTKLPSWLGEDRYHVFKAAYNAIWYYIVIKIIMNIYDFYITYDILQYCRTGALTNRLLQKIKKSKNPNLQFDEATAETSRNTANILQTLYNTNKVIILATFLILSIYDIKILNIYYQHLNTLEINANFFIGLRDNNERENFLNYAYQNKLKENNNLADEEIELINDAYNFIFIKIHDYTKEYETLGINPGATHEAVKKAYYNMARKTHPDKNPNMSDTDKAGAEEKMKTINDSKKIIDKYFEYTEKLDNLITNIL
jgi:hypothetical protein